jgi:hypothetical protein
MIIIDIIIIFMHYFIYIVMFIIVLFVRILFYIFILICLIINERIFIIIIEIFYIVIFNNQKVIHLYLFNFFIIFSFLNLIILIFYQQTNY